MRGCPSTDNQIGADKATDNLGDCDIISYVISTNLSICLAISFNGLYLGSLLSTVFHQLQMLHFACSNNCPHYSNSLPNYD
jgi:hypothetical protein